MPKKLCAFRLSPFAIETLDEIAKTHVIDRTAAFELACAIAKGALYTEKCSGVIVYTAASKENNAGGIKTPLK